MEELGCNTGVQYVVCSSRWNPSFLGTLKLLSDLGTTAITLHQPIVFCCPFCSVNSPYKLHSSNKLRMMIDQCHWSLRFAYFKAIPWSIEQMYTNVPSIWFSFHRIYGIFTYSLIDSNSQCREIHHRWILQEWAYVPSTSYTVLHIQ